MALRRTLRLAALVAGALLLVGADTPAGADPAEGGLAADAYLARLYRVEQDLGQAADEIARAEARIAELEQTLGREAAGLTTAERARRKVRRRMVGRTIAWDRAQREMARAESYLPPGTGDDARRLLRQAEARALAKNRDEIGALHTIGRAAERTRELVAERARASVELAQHRSAQDKHGAERERVIDQARAHPDAVDAELADSQAQLARSLSMLLKNETERDFHRLKGTLRPPVAAEPDHRYGPRKQAGSATYVRHTGYTWNLEAGTPVQAVGPGLVVYAARFEGYGKTVILDHGSGYHSVYAHLGEVGVEAGQFVGRADKLGLSGQTGSLEGPKLYFELRKDGRPIDPTPWFVH